MNHPGNSLRQSGFTLLEIMVALGILGIALVTCLSLINRSITLQSELEHVTQATGLARQRLTAIRSSPEPLAAQPREGRFEEPFAAYRWLLESEPSPLSGIKHLRLTVFWGSNRPQSGQKVTLESFLLQSAELPEGMPNSPGGLPGTN